jgi:predicted NUDIX family NTP pyrophosphohydrolase
VAALTRGRDSAGLLIWRRKHLGPKSGLEFLLVHPGGPYWTRKDDGAWSIPKGELEPGEDKLAAAKRETMEETGFAPRGRFRRLAPARQPSGKVVHAWAVGGDFDASAMTCTTFEMEWPPRSGRRASFPECDRAAWFGEDEAVRKITVGQRPIIEQARGLLKDDAQT